MYTFTYSMSSAATGAIQQVAILNAELLQS